jgi:hypothetical protein
MGSRWEPDTKTDWPTDRLTVGRKLTSTSTGTVREPEEGKRPILEAAAEYFF